MKHSKQPSRVAKRICALIIAFSVSNAWAVDAASQMATFAQEAKTTPNAAKQKAINGSNAIATMS